MLISRFSADWFYLIFKLFQTKKLSDILYGKLLFLLVSTNSPAYSLSFLNYGLFFFYIKRRWPYIPSFWYIVLVHFYFINFFYNSLFFFKIKKKSYIIKKISFGLTFKLRNRREKIAFIFVYLLNLFNLFKLQAARVDLSAYRYLSLIRSIFNQTLCFNIIVQKNTAFLQCVHPQRNIIFTATSTQFGFLKFKRYARFIFDFFLLLAFSLFFEFPFQNIGFNLILNPFFRFSGILKHFFWNAYNLQSSFFCRYTSFFHLPTLLEEEAISFDDLIFRETRWLSKLRFKWFIYYKRYLKISLFDLISVFFVFYSVFLGFFRFRAIDIRKICNAFCRFFNFGYLGISILIFFYDFRLYHCWVKDYLSFVWGDFFAVKLITFVFLKFTIQFIYKVVAQISFYFKKRFIRLWAIFCKFFYDHFLFVLLLRCVFIVLEALLSFLQQPVLYCCSIFYFLLTNIRKPKALSSYTFVLFFVFFYSFDSLSLFLNKEINKTKKVYNWFRHPTFLPEWRGAIRDFIANKTKKIRYIQSSRNKAIAAEGITRLPLFTVNNQLAYSGCRLAKNRRKKSRNYRRKSFPYAINFFKKYII